jgi:hypothetical protein
LRVFKLKNVIFNVAIFVFFSFSFLSLPARPTGYLAQVRHRLRIDVKIWSAEPVFW